MKYLKIYQLLVLCLFFIKCSNDDKDVFNPKLELTYPQNEEKITSQTVELKWEGESDVYDLFLGKTNPPVTKINTKDITTKSFKVENLDINSTYYWQVSARKNTGTFTGVVKNSKVFSFSTNSYKSVFVKGEQYMMGDGSADSPKDVKPMHCTIIKDFKVGVYETTHKQYIDFLNAIKLNKDGIASFKNSGKVKYIDLSNKNCGIKYENNKFVFRETVLVKTDDTPVVFVSWYGAKAYCEWIGGDLPTEAQWEFIARGAEGNATINAKRYKYSGSNNLSEVAQFKDNNNQYLVSVGSKKENQIKIYDLSGNVKEWCNDWYDANYYTDGTSGKENPQGPAVSSVNHRVTRGGAWNTEASYCKVYIRDHVSPESCSNNIGFRVAFKVK